MRTLLLTGSFPKGKPPVVPGFLELSSGLPVLTISSGDPVFARAGNRDLAGTEVLLSKPPGKILKTVLPLQWSGVLVVRRSVDLQSSS